MMKDINQIINGSVSPYTGSEATRSIAEDAIRQKYGDAEVKNMDCYHNLRTFQGWLKLGFRVRRGEKAIRSFTITDVSDSSGNVIKKIKRPVFLFYYRAVEPAGPKNRYEKEDNDD
jgi:hypothetical protein